MRHFSRTMCVLALVSLVSAQQKPQTKSTTAKPSNTKESSGAASAKAAGPHPDTASVTASTFHSDFFKFTYDLPKDWKALDDKVRIEENRKMQDEENSRLAANTLPKPKNAKSPAPAHPTAPATSKAKGPERYSLLVASPNGVESLSSAVLPRLNVWAHRRIGSTDAVGDHAQFLAATKRAQVLLKPKEVSIDGHTFVRVDILAPGGEYHSQFVTAVGDYLVGFDFLTTSERELAELTASMDAVKFQ
jgi:hypothetical protein